LSLAAALRGILILLLVPGYTLGTVTAAV